MFGRHILKCLLLGAIHFVFGWIFNHRRSRCLSLRARSCQWQCHQFHAPPPRPPIDITQSLSLHFLPLSLPCSLVRFLSAKKIRKMPLPPVLNWIYYRFYYDLLMLLVQKYSVEVDYCSYNCSPDIQLLRLFKISYEMRSHSVRLFLILQRLLAFLS